MEESDRWDQRGLVEDLLARGVDDWVDFGLVAEVARRRAVTTEEAVAALGLGLVAIVALEGLMTPGTVRDGSFEPWELDPPDAVARVVREWREIGTRKLRPADIGWLCNTATGDAVGQAVLDREAEGS